MCFVFGGDLVFDVVNVVGGVIDFYVCFGILLVEKFG